MDAASVTIRVLQSLACVPINHGSMELSQQDIYIKPRDDIMKSLLFYHHCMFLPVLHGIEHLVCHIARGTFFHHYRNKCNVISYIILIIYNEGLLFS